VVVQTLVPQTQLGVATSTLTFLRQIGGSVGLAIAGSLFSSTFVNVLPDKLASAGVPRAVAHQLLTRSGSNLTAVGNVSQSIGASLPPSFRPLVPHIITGLHDAIGSAVAQLFWLGVIAAVLAFFTTLLIREVPLRGSTPAAVRTVAA
jgi:hypothetical protein